MFFACTGIIIKNDPETRTTSFLTSLSLLRSTADDSKIFHDMTVCAALSIACFLTPCMVINRSANRGLLSCFIVTGSGAPSR
jgi:hypothetical protein